MFLKRKIYNLLLEWKNDLPRKTAILIEGVRRIGKSETVKEFGKNEYKSYILIDFSHSNKEIESLFLNHLNDLDKFFQLLQELTKTTLYEDNSLIIFDEVQLFPKARQAIKHLVADGRYDYIETGSLISIHDNVKNILIPSEEHSIKMYPMDFEEFLWALNENDLIELIKNHFSEKLPLPQKEHKKAMRLFKQYMIIGGMPQSVKAFVIKPNQYSESDKYKLEILNTYRKDIKKIKYSYKTKIMNLFDNIPAFLSKHEKRVVYKEINKNYRSDRYYDANFWLEDSMMVNQCFSSTDPSVGLSMTVNESYMKTYMGDTGLLFTLTFENGFINKDKLYHQILIDNLHINEGMLFENVIAQTLVANGYKLYFYRNYNKILKKIDIEVDFLISYPYKSNYKITPIEVKSSNKYQINSLNKFIAKYKSIIGHSFVIHTKELKVDKNIIYIPAYMTFCLKG